MFDRIASALERIPAGLRIGVAVSGGGDSVFLLNALCELRRAAAVLHVNHKLRGAESDADEGFVRELADRAGLPFFSAILEPCDGNIEQEARRLRLGFFEKCIHDGLCDCVATGHTMDDQAETLVMRFIRGAGTAGLSGILPRTDAGLIRPLLGYRRAEIRDWLTQHNVVWREDLTNCDPNFTRNRLRMGAMLGLQDLNPSLSQVLADTAEWARAEEDYWSAELDRIAPTCFETGPETTVIRIEPFSNFAVAVQRRILRRGVAHVRGNLRSIDFRHIESIREMTQTREGSGRIQLPGLDIYRSFDLLRVAPQGFDARLDRDFSAELAIPGETSLPDRGVFVRMELMPGSAVYNSDRHALDGAKCNGPMQLRNWRPGDRLERTGGAEAVRIKTLFQDHRIPLWERRSWPVIVRGEDVVWTRRFGASATYAAAPESRSILRVEESNRA